MSTPDLDEVQVYFPDLGAKVENWTEYTINQNFLTPADSWSLTLAQGDGAAEDILRALRGGEQIHFFINGRLQMCGYVDVVATAADRSQGSVFHLEGRDSFGPLVDGCVDPRLVFRPEDTLAKIVGSVLADFGFTNVIIDNAANRAIQTGGDRGIPKTSKGKDLKRYRAFQCKPHPGEGAFQFLARICSRYGLWLWPSADGQSVIVGHPDFDQSPTYHVNVKREGAITNVLRATSHKDWGEQPSAIVATARGDGNVFNRSNLCMFILNELVSSDATTGKMNAGVLKALAKIPDALEVRKSTPIKSTNTWMTSKVARVMYLHDDESVTPEQLAFFLRRELAHRQRKSLTYTVEAMGHTFLGVPWAVDTIAKIDDDYNNVQENLWVMGRTFTKSRQGGTKTSVEFIRPGTLDFEDPDDAQNPNLLDRLKVLRADLTLAALQPQAGLGGVTGNVPGIFTSTPVQAKVKLK